MQSIVQFMIQQITTTYLQNNHTMPDYFGQGIAEVCTLLGALKMQSVHPWITIYFPEDGCNLLYSLSM